MSEDHPSDVAIATPDPEKTLKREREEDGDTANNGTNKRVASGEDVPSAVSVR